MTANEFLVKENVITEKINGSSIILAKKNIILEKKEIIIPGITKSDVGIIIPNRFDSIEDMVAIRR